MYENTTRRRNLCFNLDDSNTISHNSDIFDGVASVSDQLRDVPCKIEHIGYGEDAILNTVKKIVEIINLSVRNPYVRRWAERIVSKIEPSDKIGELRAINDFVKYKTRYTRDPLNLEYLQTPPTVLKMLEEGVTPSLDCDDMTMLNLSLAKSIGFPIIIRVTSYSPNKKFSHIYGLANVNGRWISMESVKRDKQFGFEAPNYTRMMQSEV